MTSDELTTSPGGVGTPKLVRRAAYAAAARVGLFDKKTVRFPIRRRRVIVSPTVGNSASPR